MIKQKKPELLAPAGDLVKLKTAIDYGADAVYLGGKAFSLRTASGNFSYDEMAEGFSYAHERGKKCYVAINILAHNEDFQGLAQYINQLVQLKADGVIVADVGIMDFILTHEPTLPVHVSTQANVTNASSVRFYKKMGASRVVLARELSLFEISTIHQENPHVELEAFVHGAMCISYSGRCLLSNYMTGRDSNQGDCAQSCRWNYQLVEEKRPGETYPVYEDERGTYIFNSKDLCMIEHVGELIEAGVTSLKIEGRVKSEYYVATVVKAYRDAIDDYLAGRPFLPERLEELKKISHRAYTKGFYFGKPGADAQVYTSSSYIRTYELIGVVKEYDPEKKELLIEQRNRFFQGDIAEVLLPDRPFYSFKIDKMVDEAGEEIKAAPHAKMLVRIPCDIEVPVGSFLRKIKE